MLRTLKDKLYVSAGVTAAAYGLMEIQGQSEDLSERVAYAGVALMAGLGTLCSTLSFTDSIASPRPTEGLSEPAAQFAAELVMNVPELETEG